MLAREGREALLSEDGGPVQGGRRIEDCNMLGMKGGNEIECLSRNSRRIAKLRPAQIRAAKRSFWKRQRKEARGSARGEAQMKEAAN